jgi:hypothetical protein
MTAGFGTERQIDLGLRSIVVIRPRSRNDLRDSESTPVACRCDRGLENAPLEEPMVRRVSVAEGQEIARRRQPERGMAAAGLHRMPHLGRRV